MIIDALSKVYGAVAEKDIVPILTHFHLYEGRIQGTNGRLCIDTPCPEISGLDVTLPAESFMKAVKVHEHDPSLSIKDHSLIIRKNRFRVKLPLGEHDTFPRVSPDGIYFPLRGDLLNVFRRLRPFIAQVATRPWACGILLDGDYAYATNNQCIVRHPVHWEGRANVPGFAVDEVVRINEDPVEACVQENGIFLRWTDDTWLHTVLFTQEWPDVAPFFETPAENQLTSPMDLSRAVHTVGQFCQEKRQKRIYFRNGKVCTEDGEHSAEIEGFDLPDAVFDLDILQSVLDCACVVDFDCYPERIPFSGNGIDGVFMGLRE